MSGGTSSWHQAELGTIPVVIPIVPVAEEVIVVVGAEPALGALLLPVDTGGVDEGAEHGWSRQPGFEEERMESGCLPCPACMLCLLSPRRLNNSWGSRKPLSTLLPSPQPHEEMDTHPAASLVRTGLRWQKTSHPGSPPCREEAMGGQSCHSSSVFGQVSWPGCMFKRPH